MEKYLAVFGLTKFKRSRAKDTKYKQKKTIDFFNEIINKWSGAKLKQITIKFPLLKSSKEDFFIFLEEYGLKQDFTSRYTKNTKKNFKEYIRSIKKTFTVYNLECLDFRHVKREA